MLQYLKLLNIFMYTYRNQRTRLFVTTVTQIVLYSYIVGFFLLIYALFFDPVRMLAHGNNFKGNSA